MVKRDYDLLLEFWKNESLYNVNKALDYVIDKITRGNIYKKIESVFSEYSFSTYIGLSVLREQVLEVLAFENDDYKFIKGIKDDINSIYHNIRSALHNKCSTDEEMLELFKKHSIINDYDDVTPIDVYEVLKTLYPSVDFLDELYGLPF